MGGIEHGRLSLIAGTFGINQVMTKTPAIDPRWQVRASVLDDRYLAMSTSPGSAASLEWLIERVAPELIELAASQRRSPWEIALEEAAAVMDGPSQVFFQPFSSTGLTLEGIPALPWSGYGVGTAAATSSERCWKVWCSITAGMSTRCEASSPSSSRPGQVEGLPAARCGFNCSRMGLAVRSRWPTLPRPVLGGWPCSLAPEPASMTQYRLASPTRFALAVSMSRTQAPNNG
jgi:hypothetical protein